MPYDSQAEELNSIIKKFNPAILTMLSERGKAAFFPDKGILGQTADAKKCEINATIGAALEDDASAMCLEALNRLVTLPKSDLFPYTPSFGAPPLRRTWKKMMLKKNPLLSAKNISTPVVTNALTHGLSMAGYLFVDPNDTIILPDKFWGNYNLIFRNGYGARFTNFETFAPDGGYNVEGLIQALKIGSPGKRIVLLNFPNNPTGYTPTLEEGERIRDALVEAAAIGNKLIVFVDDAYFGLGYEEGIMSESIFAMLANAHERILACKFDGPTKEDYVWGFRVGFVTFGVGGATDQLYGALEAKLAGAIRGSISNVTHPGQSLLLAAYTDHDYDRQKEEKYTTLKKRYEKIKQILADHPEYSEVYEPLPFNSGYFMCVKLKGADGEAVRQRLLSHYSTGIIAFGNTIRIAFSSTPSGLLEKLYENLYRAGKDLTRRS
ncbi:MAG: aminotransferase class I/II-fold pyridoxal phosphate-dependent enzyme [Chitinivibrionales bacterium]|nr:aminotransferase class I/II-fold pyridoxal phosphate-dependent enzyme [Chitinivibrionales bacterium]MBD3357892.1 aminotransferase class I/II-fold pyridoxal phosphate-dependent enzyme [Chitinivibrionales bacterium]